jgi:hypothetical protein
MPEMVYGSNIYLYCEVHYISLTVFLMVWFHVIAKGNIILESQRPEGLEKIRQLEGAAPFQRPEVPEPQTRQRPVFTQPLQNIDAIAEGQTAHFECRLIPVGDPTLKVEWFRNEKPLETSKAMLQKVQFFYPNQGWIIV